MASPAPAKWRAEAGGIVACELCPHGCRLAEGRFGLCKVRRNLQGAMDLPFYGLISSLGLDPIEKKPLHHFLPGSSVFSAGFFGCNMRCPFCQNWSISQEEPRKLEACAAEELVAEALRSGAPSIAYTYSEPTVHFEYLLAAMASARAAGLRNVLVTNGCLESGAARELLALTDAVNLDIKCWSADSYRKVLGGELEAVLEFARLASKACLLEATTLVVPGLSDSPDGIAGIAGFLASLSEDIPLHLSAYHPAWKHEAPPTSPRLLKELAALAARSLRYVYVGNLAEGGSDSRCPSCGALAVERHGYRMTLRAVEKRGGKAFCSSCGFDLHIIV
jgi:pyruvate formate lyase activating enzyme